MKQRNLISQNGYSLIEVMVVLVITAILVGFAVSRFGSAQTFFKRQNITRELKINLERARFDAVKRRALTPVNSGDPDTRSEVKIVNATSFTVKTDLNQNGTLDASDMRTIDFTGQTDVKIVGNSLVYPISIKFDRYGRIEVKDNSSPQQNINPIFTVCTDNCTAANANATNGDVIYISPSGTVAMLKGGESQPTFSNPTVANVSVSANINPGVQVNY